MRPRRPRQFAVTDRTTREVVLVNHFETLCANGYWRTDIDGAAIAAGYRYPADCEVHAIPCGQETPLPFDSIPLVIRRGHKQPKATAAEPARELVAAL